MCDTEKGEWKMITRFAFSNYEIVDRGYLWRLGVRKKSESCIWPY